MDKNSKRRVRSTKHQAPISRESPNFKFQKTTCAREGCGSNFLWNSELGDSLELGTWNLELIPTWAIVSEKIGLPDRFSWFLFYA
jgi:hypothetical protein